MTKNKVQKIYTLRDALRDKQVAEYHAEIKATRRELRQKIRHWTKRVEMYQGEIHSFVLAKYKAELAATYVKQ